MEDKLIELLFNAFGYPVELQGSLLPEQRYPDHFFTFWNDSADGSSYYSNTEGAIIWQYSLNFYSVNTELVNNMFRIIEGTPTAKSVLKNAGWVVSGAGYSVASDEPTHTGRGITITYRQEQ